ncbi:T9SS type A sorting domain-containing protein [Tenacibaculum halocynthiae]|uniref:T9SS type A sorting domain-containing protein n=1 Tax=Tenacibaculum halocynthiae TaxID=1254437 RepID=UPI003D649202
MKKNYIFILSILYSFTFFSQTNLITNGGFENWTNTTTLNDWTTENNVSKNNTDFKEGNFSASLTVTNDNIKPKVFIKVPMENGIEYTVTYKYKYVDSNYGGTHPINLKIIKTGSNSTISNNQLATNNNWTTVVKKFTPDQTGNYDFSISTATYNGEGFNVLIDDVRVFDPNNTSNDIVTIPDANFKKALLNHSPTIDTNGDNEIQVSEAESFTNNLNCSNKNITDITGIKYFTNLSGLYCSDNKLKSLDISKNTKLRNLYFSDNEITNIDLTNNTELAYLYCVNNKITNLNVSKNNNLLKVFCHGNAITSLDLTKNENLQIISCGDSSLSLNTLLLPNNLPQLTTLTCTGSNLISLNITGATLLKRLHFTNSQISSLDLSKNLELTEVIINNNKITSLDLTKNSKITNLRCKNNLLTNLNITKCIDLPELYCSNNRLNSLDLTHNTKLTKIEVFNNLLDKLDLSTNNLLTDLRASENKITSITLNKSLKNVFLNQNQLSQINTSTLNDIEYLYVDNNKLTSLNISTNKKIKNLNCSSNLISVFDISLNPDITSLYIDNNKLTSLNVANGNNDDLDYLQTQNNKDLSCIKIDSNYTDTAKYGWKTSANTSYSSNCLKFNEIVNIPDTNFKDYLLKKSYININEDTEIQIGEAENYSGGIYADNLSISNLTGIEAFKNITGLSVSNNSLVTINLENNQKLNNLTLSSNNLSSINLEKNYKLNQINLNNNKLTEINLTNNIELKKLSIESNFLTYLDLSTNILIEKLWLFDNKITDLDILNCKSLTILQASANKLTTLNLSNNSKLYHINLYNNLLEALDVTNSKVLTELNLNNNNLNKLNISNGNNPSLKSLQAVNNPNLTCIQVDNVSFANTINNDKWYKDNSASYSENCSATANINDQTLNGAISIYPNPSKNFIKVKSNTFYKVSEIKLTTLLGKEIMTSKKPELNISYLAKGIYLLKIKTNNNKIAIKKIIKK